MLKKVGDLDIAEDVKHQRMIWQIQRMGWALMLLVLGAALAGLLGPGPLSKAIAEVRGGDLSVHYERFVRYQAPCRLRIRIGPNAVTDGKVRLWVSRQFVDQIEIQRLDPEPAVTELHPRGLLYVIAAGQLREQATVTFHYQPDQYGKLPVSVGLENGAQLALTQWVYP